MTKISEVDLCGTRLTDLQVSSVFLEMLDQSSIQKIALDGLLNDVWMVLYLLQCHSAGNVEMGYKEFMNSLKDKANLIVTFDRSHKITTIHLFKKF